MDKFVIRGGNPLLGMVRISGAKNAALPAWPPPCSPTNRSSSKTFRKCVISRPRANFSPPWAPTSNSAMAALTTAPRFAAKTLASPEASYELVKTMRASTLVLGPLVARCGRARVSLPGGCAIGAARSTCILRDWNVLAQDHARTWLCRSHDRSVARRRNCFRQNHRHGHGRFADGGYSRRWRNGHAKLCSRTRSRRSSRICSTRWARRLKARAHPRFE